MLRLSVGQTTLQLVDASQSISLLHVDQCLRCADNTTLALAIALPTFPTSAQATIRTRVVLAQFDSGSDMQKFTLNGDGSISPSCDHNLFLGVDDDGAVLVTVNDRLIFKSFHGDTNVATSAHHQQPVTYAQEQASRSWLYKRRNDPSGKPTFPSHLISHPQRALVVSSSGNLLGNYTESMRLGPAEAAVSFVVDGPYIRRADNYALALEVDNGKMAVGTPVIAFPCEGDGKQQFMLHPDGSIAPVKAAHLRVGADDASMLLVDETDGRVLQLKGVAELASTFAKTSTSIGDAAGGRSDVC